MSEMLIVKIKHDQLVARKNRDQIESTLLTTLIGEADMVGKNNGNRDPFDEEVISVVKKFLKGVNETIAIPREIWSRCLSVREGTRDPGSIYSVPTHEGEDHRDVGLRRC